MVSWKAAAALAVVLVVLAVFTYRQTHQPSPATAAGTALVACDSGNTLEIDYRKAPQELVLQRASTSARWMVVEPAAAEADPTSASNIASEIHSFTRATTLDTTGSLDVYGLLNPARTMTCRVVGGGSYTLSIGNQSFDGSGYYALLAGDPRVYVISGAPVIQLDQALQSPPVQPSAVPAGSPSP